jgi:hypothetical protein
VRVARNLEPRPVFAAVWALYGLSESPLNKPHRAQRVCGRVCGTQTISDFRFFFEIIRKL